jgi:hypothetical protein
MKALTCKATILMLNIFANKKKANEIFIILFIIRFNILFKPG